LRVLKEKRRSVIDFEKKKEKKKIKKNPRGRLACLVGVVKFLFPQSQMHM